MPKVIKKKVTKPAKTEDGVRNVIRDVQGFTREKQRVLFPIVIAVAIICLGAVGFSMYRSSMQKEAAALEYEGYKLYYGLYQKQPFANEERYQKALEQFTKAYAKRKSPVSLFYIASSYYELGKLDDSLKTLNELNERFPDDERFTPLSYYKMAVIQVRKGDKEAALKLLDSLYGYRSESFKDLALMESAGILDSMGKKDEAMKKYEELTKNFPSSPFAADAKTKLEEKKS
ncbi:MAG TPA: tetratricopeptide repeat protein [Thermodesulfovibrionales bacterium]|nr:tetratricopeptide repeat protein [Thermodesulfovibrionales bacterium]